MTKLFHLFSWVIAQFKNPLYRVVQYPEGYCEVQKRFIIFFWITERTPEDDTMFMRFSEYFYAKSYLYFIPESKAYMTDPLLVKWKIAK